MTDETKYLYTPEGVYIGGYAESLLSDLEFEFIEGPAPNHAQDRYIDGKLIPYTGLDLFTATQQIKTAVGAMDSNVLIRYAGEASLINQFLDNGNFQGAIGLLNGLQAKIIAADDTEAAAALGAVMAILGQVEG